MIGNTNTKQNTFYSGIWNPTQGRESPISINPIPPFFASSHVKLIHGRQIISISLIIRPSYHRDLEQISWLTKIPISQMTILQERESHSLHCQIGPKVIPCVHCTPLQNLQMFGCILQSRSDSPPAIKPENFSSWLNGWFIGYFQGDIFQSKIFSVKFSLYRISMWTGMCSIHISLQYWHIELMTLFVCWYHVERHVHGVIHNDTLGKSK